MNYQNVALSIYTYVPTSILADSMREYGCVHPLHRKRRYCQVRYPVAHQPSVGRRCGTRYKSHPEIAFAKTGGPWALTHSYLERDQWHDAYLILSRLFSAFFTFFSSFSSAFSNAQESLANDVQPFFYCFKLLREIKMQIYLLIIIFMYMQTYKLACLMENVLCKSCAKHVFQELRFCNAFLLFSLGKKLTMSVFLFQFGDKYLLSVYLIYSRYF